MNASSRYHDIPLHPNDQEKTAFIIDKGLCCYKVMRFGLTKAGATYQLLINKIFECFIGK